jgi:hypothetical protein
VTLGVSFVLSTPVRFVDPSGHDPDCAIGDTLCKQQVANEKQYAYWVSTGQVDPLPPGMLIPSQLPSQISDPKLMEGWIWCYNTAKCRKWADDILYKNTPVTWGNKTDTGGLDCRSGVCIILIPPNYKNQENGLRQVNITMMMGHEAYHLSKPFGSGKPSLYEEYIAFNIGYSIGKELIIRYRLKDFIIRDEFGNEDPLNADQLIQWFDKYHPAYVDYYYAGSYTVYPWY